jgi:hypothetical protein
MAKSNTQSAVTLTPEALRAVIAQAIAEHDAQKAQQAKADTSTEMEALTIKAFRRAGYKAEDIRPRENIKTYNLWLQDGFRVKPGETSVRVKTLRLFHASQVDKLNPVEAKKALAELEAKRSKRTADKLPPVSPVAAAPKPAKGKGAASQPTA